jgi:hypothetical protein
MKKGRVAAHEKQAQLLGSRLYATAGCLIINFSQSRASRQTAGIPDTKVYHPTAARAVGGVGGMTWWHEWKTAGGRVSAAQRAFHTMARACGEVVIVGGVAAVWEQLERVGLARVVDGQRVLVKPARGSGPVVGAAP